MKKQIIAVCVFASLLFNRASADSGHALKAIVPGLGHISAEQNYRAVLFASFQMSFIYMGFKKYGLRESALLGNKRAIALQQEESDDSKEMHLYERGGGLYNDESDYRRDMAIYFGLAGAVYIASIVDAWFIKTGQDPGAVSMRMGLNGGLTPMVFLSKSF